MIEKKLLETSYVYEKLTEFQNRYNITNGLNVFVICKKLDIELVKYKQSNRSLMQISKDGFSYHDKEDDKYYIFYNDDAFINRIPFTIAHEIGHIILNHHSFRQTNIFSFKNNSRRVHSILERQANIFAQNLLMPAEITESLSYFNVYQLSKYFGVSNQMAKVRLENLPEDLDYFRTVEKESNDKEDKHE